MVVARPQAVCFVAMPSARQPIPDADRHVIDFDEVYSRIERAVTDEGLECVRADVEPGRGFHTDVAERLLVAQYVVADVTYPDPQVAYVVGVRHGAGRRPTIVVGAQTHLGGPPFDARSLPVITYDVAANGELDAADGEALGAMVRRRLREAVDGDAGVDVPIIHVTGRQSDRLEHDKTDLFLALLRETGEVGSRIGAALEMDDRGAALDALATIEESLVEGGDAIAELGSALLGVYLAYRERASYQQMVDLFPKLSPELQATAVAREQLALALNRLAEEHDRIAKSARETADHASTHRARDRSRELRARAVGTLDDMDERMITAETWAIRGRVYKAWFEAERVAEADDDAASLLSQAIEAYERGMAADLRDYFPGVNAVTLRLVRAGPDDLTALEMLIPVVRMAVDHAPPALSRQERYWQEATKLELPRPTTTGASRTSTSRRH